MALEVIGAGYGRTGTLSLKFALEKLGFDKCYHMMEVFQHPEHVPMWAAAQRGEHVDWNKLYDGYSATVDWPSCNFWREHAAFYPKAKVILSTRDPDKWYESVMNTIYVASTGMLNSPDPQLRAMGEWATRLTWDGVFGGRMHDKAHVLDVLRKHEATVKATIPRERLLVFDAKEGWEPLCRFLGKPVPAEPYPRVNTREDFGARNVARQVSDTGENLGERAAHIADEMKRGAKPTSG